MGVVNTDDLGRAIAAQSERMLVDLLDYANGTIVELSRTIRDKDDVIRQYAEKAREDAITIARLRLRGENDAALTRAIAARDARAKGLADVADYAQECRRTTDFQR